MRKLVVYVGESERKTLEAKRGELVFIQGKTNGRENEGKTQQRDLIC